MVFGLFVTFEYMACVGLRHVSRISLFAFTFDVFDMFLYTLFGVDS